MSAELTKARQQLAQVRQHIKQDKQVSAVQTLQSALVVVLKHPLIKSEREEFEKLIAEAADLITKNEKVLAAYPMKISYTPGMERTLYEEMKGVIQELERAAVEEAQAELEAMERRKKEWLARGMEELATDQNRGLATLAALIREYPDEPELRGSVGEALLKARLYEPAVTYLTEALDLKPDMLPHYNNIGIALRKLSRFEAAEQYYLRASQHLRHDPNLYFNIGRLYVDWGKWSKAMKAAGAALKLDPDFVEAQKLHDYAEKRAAQSPA